MRAFRESVALAVPACGSLKLEVEEAIRALRTRRNGPEVRMGAGWTAQVPLRVLGFAAAAGDALEHEAMLLVDRRPERLALFSSSPKLTAIGARLDPGAIRASSLLGLAGLAGALRIVGVTDPIRVEEAPAAREVPDDIARLVRFSAALERWLAERQLAHPEADARLYAMEHAAPSMFGDLAGASPAEPLLRVTIGPRPESRFFAARMAVAATARAAGLPIVPGLGLILRGAKRPWYQPIPEEPLFGDLLRQSVAQVVDRLRWSARPERGGNSGLKREVHLASRLLSERGAEIVELARHLESPANAARFLRTGGFEIGPRLEATLLRAVSNG